MRNSVKALTTALFCLACVTIPLGTAFAQEPPRSAAARAELEAVSLALREEGIGRAVASIAARLDKLDPAKAARVRKKLEPSDAFTKAHLEAELEATITDLFQAELGKGTLAKEDLKVDFTLFRSFRTGYRIRPMDPRSMPEVSNGFSPPRSRGYLPEVAAIDAAEPHSMHDLDDYVADRFTHAALERIVKKGYVVELHVGSEAEAFTDLRNRGWNVFGEVRVPNGSYERMFLAESPKGELRYVISGDVDGLDRVRHLSALLRFANKTGVPADKVEIVGDVKKFKEAEARSLRENLASLPREGTTAIVGFRMALRNELTERALARAGVENLRDVLGEDPYLGLQKKLAAEIKAARGAERAKLEKVLEAVEGDRKLATGLRIEARDAFLHAKDLKSVQDAEKTLAALAKTAGEASDVLGKVVADERLRLIGGDSAADYEAARSVESGALRADEVLVRGKEGVRSVLLVNNYYGDSMGTVVEALLESGRRRIAYFGTAGGTSADARVGDVHVPGEVFDYKLQPASTGVHNGFLDYFAGKLTALGNRLILKTKLGNVFSPVAETMKWLTNVRSRGIDAVEVETSHVTRAIAAYNAEAKPADRAELYAAVMISDVPGSELTLGNNNGKTTYTFEKMVDHYLEALEIDDLLLRRKGGEETEKPAAPRPLATDAEGRKVLDVADRLVPRNLSRSTALRDRIATIIGNADLSGVKATGKLKPSEIAGLSASARAALEAEVAGAYTDADRNASLERANAVVSLLSKELRAKHPSSPYVLRVGGGIESGTYSPVAGMIVEVLGDAGARADAEKLLPGVLLRVSGAPPVRVGLAGSRALDLGGGEAFLSEPTPLVRLNASEALARRGAVPRGSSVDYAGRVAWDVRAATENKPRDREGIPLTRFFDKDRASGKPVDKTVEREAASRGLIDALVKDRVRARAERPR